MKNPVTTALLLLTAAISTAQAADIPPGGEKWKVTTSMQMSGMSLPGQSSDFCKVPGDDSVPIKKDDNCEIYDMNRSGNVQSFKMRCKGKDPMEGSGQVTYVSKDRYQGKMEVKTGGETMTMAYEGQKLGACDGSEGNLQAKKLLAQAEQQQVAMDKAQAERCHQVAREASSPMMMKSTCTDPTDRKVFCEAVRTHDKFLPLAEQEKASHGINKPLSDSAAMCGFNLKTEREQLCRSAESQDKLGFISSQCPSEADRLAAAQCAGRRYTAISDKYRAFCSTYASNNHSSEDSTPAGVAKGLLDKSKKGLGGLFGR